MRLSSRTTRFPVRRTLAAAALLPLAWLTVQAGTASASPAARAGAAIAATSSCYANPSPSTCDNTDPSNTGCSADAYTAASAAVRYQNGGSVGTIQLRYSPHCGTNWARFIKTTSTAGLATVQTCLGYVFVHCTADYSSYGSLLWSNQLYARTTIATAYGWFVDGSAGASGQASG